MGAEREKFKAGIKVEAKKLDAESLALLLKFLQTREGEEVSRDYFANLHLKLKPRELHHLLYGLTVQGFLIRHRVDFINYNELNDKFSMKPIAREALQEFFAKKKK